MNVLLVEYDAVDRAIVVVILESEGFAVTTVKVGFAAMQLLVPRKFSLLITKRDLPDTNGLKLVRYLRDHPVHKTYKQLPVLILSSFAWRSEREQAMKLGAAYLVRPWSPRDLIRSVREMLALDLQKPSD